jgi:hypothetical protein
VDSYRYLPHSFRADFESLTVQETESVWANLTIPLTNARVALLTSSGLYLKDQQPSFDIQSERENPLWGDPTFRELPRDVTQDQIAASHLHLNTRDFYIDFNIAFPLRRFAEFEAEGRIGSLADINYSFMGYQEDGAPEWRSTQGPQLIQRLREQEVNALILAPA